MEIIMNQIPKHYTIDLSSVTDLWDFHDIIAEALDFPDYYGCNWDAFWDCLTDIFGDVRITLYGFKRFEQIASEEASILLELLYDYKHRYNDKYANRITIEIVRGDRHEFIE